MIAQRQATLAATSAARCVRPRIFHRHAAGEFCCNYWILPVTELSHPDPRAAPRCAHLNQIRSRRGTHAPRRPIAVRTGPRRPPPVQCVRPGRSCLVPRAALLPLPSSGVRGAHRTSRPDFAPRRCESCVPASLAGARAMRTARSMPDPTERRAALTTWSSVSRLVAEDLATRVFPNRCGQGRRRAVHAGARAPGCSAASH